MGKRITLEEVIDERMIELPDVFWEGSLYKARGTIDKYNEGLQNVRGVYTLIYKQEVIYVGVSINIKERLTEHYSGSINSSIYNRLMRDYTEEEVHKIRESVRVNVYKVDHTAYADMLEAYIIGVYRPKYNVESNGESRGNSYNNYRINQIETDKEEVIKLYKEGLSMRRIGEMYGRSSRTVSRHLNRWGIDTTPDTVRLMKEEHRGIYLEAVKEYMTNEEMSYQDITDKYGVSKRQFSRWFNEYRDQVIEDNNLQESEIRRGISRSKSFKYQVVNDYLTTKDTSREVSKKYNISSSSVLNWTGQYQEEVIDKYQIKDTDIHKAL